MNLANSIDDDTRMQNQAKLESMDAAKSKSADIVKQWDSTMDDRTRDTHRRLHEQVRELDDSFEIDGMTADAPDFSVILPRIAIADALSCKEP